MREALLFCFNLKNWLPNRIEYLWRPMATILYRKQCAEISFAGSMTTILTWVKRSMKIGPWELSIAGSFGRYPIAKNACRAIGCLKQPFPCDYMPWGRFKRSENGCRTELNDKQMKRRQKHMSNSACQTKKKVVPASDCDRRWKVDLFSES